MAQRDNLRSRHAPAQPSDQSESTPPSSTQYDHTQPDHTQLDHAQSDHTKPPSLTRECDLTRRKRVTYRSINNQDENSTASLSNADTPKPVLSKGNASVEDPAPWPRSRLLIVLLLFRWVNAALTQTFFVPDEYWQSLEVAHNIVFGYGYLTWEWQIGLRGFTHPVIFAILYKALQLLNLDHPMLLVLLPKILQATFSAVGDYYLYKFAQSLWGEHVARWTLFSHLSSWFVFYTAARTLTNTMEMILTIWAMHYYPWPSYMIKGHDPSQHSCAALSCSLLMDRVCYGKWIFVHFNFLRFNALYNVSSFYGTQPWHWYLTQGLPVMIGTHVFPFILGIRLAGRVYRPLVLLMIWTQFVYSLLEHKEYRFLLPLLPIAMSFCGVCFSKLSKAGRASSLAIFILVSNLPVCLYTGLVHQRGTLDVMNYLQTVAHAPNAHIRTPSVLFLMPCHSTPLFSHIHANISMRFLECPPNLSRYRNAESSYQDEADVFFDNPSDWLKAEFRPGSNLPRYLVFYDVLLPKIKRFLSSRRYSLTASFFHTHVPLDSRIGKYVLVYSRPLKIPLTPA
ncbi:GPI mannosyltransferase 3-like isoform X2 [Acanthaster planci]|uniref:Mannosyltransferase n=1 Tax=Acanthaster planci TaxID=133434 RepID=A0A8B7ZCH6_ACAPL|nr:GPI mannosyltransferase 3-like isoform X2 [Acanthaster planci]